MKSPLRWAVGILQGMTRLHFATSLSSLTKGNSSLLVLGSGKTVTKARLGRDLPKALSGAVTRLLADLDPGNMGAGESALCEGDPAKVSLGLLPPEGSRYNSPARAESLRRLFAGSGFGSRKKAALLLLVEDAEQITPWLNAIVRCLPLFSRKSAKKKGASKLTLLVLDPKGKVLRISKESKAIMEATRQACRLVDSPPTDMHPGALAKEARAWLRGLTGVKIREIKGEALLKEGLGGIHAVGRCALEAPRLLIASYDPGKARNQHVALVGKGITYDTGGLNIKIQGGMSGMKGDMGGAAAMLGAFHALASTACKHRVTLLLCLAENAIGPRAYKPDDILEMHSGKTVEINNTDAEGRLVLADGVSYASRKLKADVVIDAATLTGAQLVATGNLHAAIVSNDQDLEDLCIRSGRKSGDLCHPLPFAPEFYQSEFTSPVADMRNSVKNRMNAQSACAAQFVFAHLDDTKARWCHIDLAGPSSHQGRGTGFGVALVEEMVRSI